MWVNSRGFARLQNQNPIVMWQIWTYIIKGRVEKGMVTTTLDPTQMIIVLLILQCHTCVHMHIAMIHSLDIDCPQSCTTSCICAFGNTNPREIQLPFWCVALVIGYTTEVPTLMINWSMCISLSNQCVACSDIVTHNRESQMIQMLETWALCKELNNW